MECEIKLFPPGSFSMYQIQTEYSQHKNGTFLFKNSFEKVKYSVGITLPLQKYMYAAQKTKRFRAN